MRTNKSTTDPALLFVGLLAILTLAIWAMVAAVDVYGVTIRIHNVPAPILRLFRQG